MRIRGFIKTLGALLTFGFALTSQGQTLDAAADSYVQRGAGGSNFGTAGELRVKLNVEPGVNNFDRKAYTRFDLSSLGYDHTAALLSADLNLEFIDSGAGAGGTTLNWQFSVYGLNDGDAGEAWGETTITWNNAPANNTADGNGLLGNATLLGTFSFVGRTASINFTGIGGTAVRDFVAASSSDDNVSFIVVRDTPQPNSGNSYVHAIASKETGGGVNGPQLVLVRAFIDPVTPCDPARLSPHADSYVRRGAGNSNFGNDGDQLVKIESAGNVNNFDRKAYTRFDLSTLLFDHTAALVSGDLTLKFCESGLGAGGTTVLWEFEVYGLNDGDAGEGWGETTITWNNAPANDLGLGNGVLANATSLGTFNLLGRTGVVNFMGTGGTAVRDFVAASSSDDLVTFILVRNTPQPSGQTYVHALPARENPGGPGQVLNLEPKDIDPPVIRGCPEDQTLSATAKLVGFDDFEDGTRTSTPSGCDWFASETASLSVALDFVFFSQVLRVDPQGGFDSSVAVGCLPSTTLGVGDFIQYNAQYRIPGGPTGNGGIRFGLHNQRGTTATADGQFGVVNNDIGFYVYLRENGNIEFWREFGGASGPLGGTDRGQLGPTLVDVIDIDDDAIHDVSLCVTRINGTQVEVRVTLDGQSFAAVSTPPNSDYFTFDEIGISEGMDQVWLLDNVSLVASPDGCQAKVPDLLGSVTATDSCSDEVTITQNPTPGTLIGLGDNPITITATDDVGNESECVVTIAVEDTTPPTVIDCPSDATAQCNAVPEAVDPTFSDNCDDSLTVDFDVDSDDVTCPTVDRLTRTWTATDDAGNQAVCVQVVTVIDTIAPVLAATPADVTVQCHQIPNAPAVTATDACDGILNAVVSDAAGDCRNAPDGLIHLYRAEGNADDSIGGAHGTLVNATTTAGFVGDAFNFDGSGDRVDLPNTVMDGLTDFTVEFWMNSGDANEATFISAANLSQFNEFIIIQQPVGISQVRIFVKGSPWNTGAQILDSAWHHIAFTRSGGTGTLFIDGLFFGSSGVSSAALDVDVTGLMFGQEQDSLGGGFTPAQDLDGMMDDIGFYDRALTADEVADIHGAGSEGKCRVEGDCPQESFITRTWTATDACGNRTSADQVITVIDTTAPTLALPADVTVECDETTDPCDEAGGTGNQGGPFTPKTGSSKHGGGCTGLATASDNCGEATVTHADSIADGTCPQSRVITRTWTATDECGNRSNGDQTITVVDTTAPVISCPGDTTIQCDESSEPGHTGAASATDNCDDLAAQTADCLWLNEIHYDNSGADVNEFIEVAGTAGRSLDGCVLALYRGNGTVYHTEALSGTIPNEGDGYGARAFFISGIQNGRNGFALALCLGDGNVQFLSYESTPITATDGPAAGLTSTLIGVTESPIAAGFSLQLEDSGVGLAVTTIAGSYNWANDVNNPATPDALNNPQTVSPISGATCIDYSDSVSAGSCPQELTIRRTWTATDSCGNSSSCVQTIQVIDTTPPVIDCPDNATVECDASTDPADTGEATARDNCDDARRIAPDDLWLNEIHYDNTGGDVNEFIEVAGVAGRSLDACVLALYRSNGTVYKSVALSGTIPDEGNGYGAKAFFISGIQNGANGFALALCLGPDEVRFLSYEGSPITATEGPANGLTSTLIGVTETPSAVGDSLQLEDSGAGLAVTTIAGTFVWANDVNNPATPGVLNDPQTMNPPGGTVAISHVDSVAAGTCPQQSVITRTWIAVDSCGNSSRCDQIITIVDRIAPAITCPANETVECDEDNSSAATGTATGTDNCDPEVTITETESEAGGTCPQERVITRTWTATDDCGNASSCDQIVTVDDSTAPAITCPANETVECDEDNSSAATGTATGTDNCDPEVTITETDSVAAGTCPQEEVITRTWTATDDCGNATSCDQTIVVQDTTAPTFDQMPASEEVDCSGAQCPETGSGASGCSQNDSISVGSGSARIDCPAPLQTNVPPVPEVTAQDNCDDNVDVGLVEVQIGECPGCIVRTWTATDDCGNETEMIQLIVLRKACVQNWAYWKGRPEEWLTPFGPVTEFELGCDGDITSAADALLILNGCVGKKSDESVKLAQELIAAILNVAQGADDTCAVDAIQEARDYLCVVAVGSNPKGQLKKTAKGLRAALSDYNLGKCCAPRCPEVSGSGANFDCPSGSGGHIDYVPEEVEPHPNAPAGN